MSIFTKAYQAVEASLDARIAKSRPAETGSQTAPAADRVEHLDNDRKGYVDTDIPTNEQGLFREQFGTVPNDSLKAMARRDAVIMAIHQCLVNQVSNFSQEQVDKYSPGFRFRARKPADLTREEKLSLNDPELDDEGFKALEFTLEQKRSKMQDEQEKEISKLVEFITYCGSNKLETNTTYKRMDFDKFIKLIVRDVLTYNYLAAEMIPNRGGSAITSFHPVSARTVRYVAAPTKAQAEINNQYIKTLLGDHASKKTTDKKPYRYAQVLRGKPVAAWTEDEFVYEPLYPTVDPDDYGYAQGPLHWLVNTVTNHLYAENHNRNFFTNGTAKGILHIKGNNINRAQLEGFKRSWFAQLTGTNNSFRPPIIGMADDVRWVPFTQTNAEMEFQEWMQYLIKIACAAYQIDPAEINFDITRTNTSTMNESNNEHRIKSSKNKGLRPLLMFLQNVINNHIIPRYNKDLAAKYVFEFVGLDAETKKQEIDRLKDEVQVYKTVNEVRNEQGMAPIESGDIILAATYTQYLAQKAQAEQAAQGLGPDGQPLQGDDSEMPENVGNPNLGDEDLAQDDTDIDSDIDDLMTALNTPAAKPDSEMKKALTVEYHHYIER